MRIAALLLALVAHAAHAKQPVRSAPTTAVVVKVAFPRGNPFPKHRFPELQVIEPETDRVVASVRPREWSKQLATYAASLPAGRTYELRWRSDAQPETFARLPVSADATSAPVYRIPYVPLKAVASR
jgi:hypothetical protein